MCKQIALFEAEDCSWGCFIVNLGWERSFFFIEKVSHFYKMVYIDIIILQKEDIELSLIKKRGFYDKTYQWRI